ISTKHEDQMKLTMEQVLTIAAGLRALDGLERIVKDGERERVVREPYQLGGGLRLAIARNLNRLDAAQSAYQKARSDLVFAMADANGQLSPARMAEFAFEERKMLGAEEEFD